MAVLITLWTLCVLQDFRRRKTGGKDSARNTECEGREARHVETNDFLVEQQVGGADLPVENLMNMKTVGRSAQHSEQWNELFSSERFLRAQPILQRSAISK